MKRVGFQYACIRNLIWTKLPDVRVVDCIRPRRLPIQIVSLGRINFLILVDPVAWLKIAYYKFMLQLQVACKLVGFHC